MKYLRVTPRNNEVTMRDPFDSLFEPFFDNFFSLDNTALSMKTDITERENDYLFEIEMAGANKDNIEITLDEGYMKVTAKSNTETEKKEHGYLRKERTYGSRSRTFYVGDIAEEDISAKYDNGVLQITVAKTQPKQSQTKRININ